MSSMDGIDKQSPSWSRVLLMVAVTLTLATPFLGATKRTFQTGKLLSVTADERLIEGTSYRRAIFSVQIGDLVITSRGGRIRLRSGDIGQGLIVGDAVQVAIDGGDLILLKPDGKELKTKIIKRERAPEICALPSWKKTLLKTTSTSSPANGRGCSNMRLSRGPFRSRIVSGRDGFLSSAGARSDQGR
jgi:hypothetical protein